MVETVNAQEMFTVQPAKSVIGAEIVGLDLSQELTNETFNKVRDAYYRYSVIVFRDQKLTPEQHISFSRRFGELEIHVLKEYLLPRHPEILVISNIVENGKNIGLADAGRVAVWHTDMSYLKEPSAGSALYALEIPHDDAGRPLGNTLFASTAAAYDALPKSMKERLEGLKAIHHMTKGYDNNDGGPATRIRYSAEERKNNPDVAHPIVRTHPITGRKCLYISELSVTGFVGMPLNESTPLLEDLFTHCVRPEFIYRHQWRVGDLLMWDNCSLQHNAVQNYSSHQRRLMHRTTLKGSVPF